MSEIKPCPHCGGEAHISVYYDFYRVGCSTKHCQSELPEIFNMGSTDNNWYGSIPDAIEAWNKRYEPTCTYDLVIVVPEDGTHYKCDHCQTTVSSIPDYCPTCGRKVLDE